MDEKKLAELMKDEAFVEKMLGAATEEEVKTLFRSRGMELTTGDIDVIAKAVANAAQMKEPISEKDLGSVSGGSNGGYAALGAAGGVGASALVAGAVYGAYRLYRKGVEDGKREISEYWNTFKNYTNNNNNTNNNNRSH